jgi:hypothetical protein
MSWLSRESGQEYLYRWSDREQHRHYHWSAIAPNRSQGAKKHQVSGDDLSHSYDFLPQGQE